MSNGKTAIVTGAQHGIGAGLVDGFLKASYNVVATSQRATSSLTASPTLVLVARVMGLSVGAVKARVFHGRRKLCKKLQRYEPAVA